MKKQLALLRGINVGGNKKVPMADLRDVADKLGFGNVATFIQSGNLVFTSDLSPRDAETALEKAIAKRFGFPVEVIVRTAAEWARYAKATPFADAEAARPHLVLLGLAKRPLKAGAVAALLPYAKFGERIESLKDALWIDFGASIGKSKLSPAVLDRAAGSTITARNWKTVQKLDELLR